MKNFIILPLAIFSLSLYSRVPNDQCEHLKKVLSFESSSTNKKKFSKYIIDPDVLNRIACHARLKLEELKRKGMKTHLAQKQTVDFLTNQLSLEYPGYVLKQTDWMFNIAGGALFQISVQACNLKEYLVIFQSPIGTEGYSGKYKAELWDFIIDGFIEDYKLGEFKKHTWVPGTYTYMRPGDSQGFKASENTLVLEYGRGKIGASIRFGILANRKNLGRKETRKQLFSCGKKFFKTAKAKRILRRKKKNSQN